MCPNTQRDSSTTTDLRTASPVGHPSRPALSHLHPRRGCGSPPAHRRRGIAGLGQHRLGFDRTDSSPTAGPWEPLQSG